MGTLWQDLRYGARMLLNKPGFTAVAVLALALGIGANSAIFSVVNAVLLRPLPYEDSNRLVLISEYPKQEGVPDTLTMTSYPNINDWRDQNHVFEGVASFRTSGFTLTGVEQPERLNGVRVSADFFNLLRVRPLIGRSFLPEEDRPGGERVVLMSHSLWQRRYGGAADVVGRTLVLSDEQYRVIGVLPADFNFPFAGRKTELWATTAYEGQNLTSRGSRTSFVIARLKAGVSVAQAQADLERIASRIEQQYPDINTGLGVHVTGMQEQLVGKVRPALWMLLGAVGFVLLIACSNVANLLLARATVRQREVAIRTALGAGRWRIVRQLLTESLLLAGLAGAVGLLMAVWGIDLLVALSPSDLPRFDTVRVDARVLGFTMFVSLLTGVIFGLAPALKTSRIDLTQALKEGSRSLAHAGLRLKGLLVVSEMALALVLLIGAGLLIKSFWRLQDVDPGFNPKNVLTMRINLPDKKYPEGKERIAFVKGAIERINALPGVERAAFVTPVPFSGDFIGSSFAIDGRPAPVPGQEPSADFRGITPDYFSALNVPLIRGRYFTEQDRKGSVGAAIINETLARRYFSGEDPIGKSLIDVGVGVDEDEPKRWEIVGVVGDVRHRGLDIEPAPEVYLPHQQQAWNWGYFVIRTRTEPSGLAASVIAQILSIDKDQAVARVQTLDQMIAGSVARPRFYMLLLTVFAGVGLILTVVGIYGVMAYSVAERTHEIGIRMALGARQRDVLRMVLGHGMLLALAGIALGLAAAFLLTRVVASLLFEVSATDPLTFACVALLAALVALLACYIPARRATRVDPMIALRYE
ncbi:MAG TPA: ABC transporter permease [Pyrinomonadaceae bacterium]|jgi:putative ABC transport system permease protein|nr:ABC transporter permease [Pyrinomonadaceae bacterium]